MSTSQTRGIVLLYNSVPPDAGTILEHVGAFPANSRFPVWPVNTDYGFPPALAGLDPSVIVLHYSLFGVRDYALPAPFLAWLDGAHGAYRIAFFQDEYQFGPTRFRFIDEHRIDCVYTLVEQEWQAAVYGAHTHGPRMIHTLTGYVSDELIAAAARLSVPDAERTVDIGYRGRSLPYRMGRGSQEKRDIGLRFRELAGDRGLRLDIEVDEGARLYGDAWTRFIASSRGFLGVEAGVSVFDLDDSVGPAVEGLLAQDPSITFEEVSRRVLAPHEDRIPYRTISPRHFEAAAFRVVQILFEGHYNGILLPIVHYLPLRKDFSNLDEVLALFGDAAVRREITERAYADLIASGRYSYRRFIEAFDADLEAQGLVPGDRAEGERVARLLARGTGLGRLRARIRPTYRRLVPRAARVRAHDLLAGALAKVRRRG